MSVTYEKNYRMDSNGSWPAFHFNPSFRQILLKYGVMCISVFGYLSSEITFLEKENPCEKRIKTIY